MNKKKKDGFNVNTTCHLSHGRKYTTNEFSGLGNVQIEVRKVGGIQFCARNTDVNAWSIMSERFT